MATLQIAGCGAERVLVLPGMFGGRDAFDNMLKYADLQRFQFVIMDYRGFGPAKNEAGLYNLREAVTDAVKLLDYLGWQKTTVVGHSVGALLAQMLALATPSRIACVVSVAGLTARGAPRDADRLRGMTQAATNLDALAEIINSATGKRYLLGFSRHLAARSQISLSPAALAGYVEDAMSTDIRGLLGGSQLPYLAIVGKYDPSNTEATAREVTLKSYPNAQLEVLECGHYPMIECPAQTLALIEQFHHRVSGPAS